MHSRAPPKKPAGKDSRIIQHQAVARPQELRQVAEHTILPALFFAMQHEHARSRAVLEWRLRDQLRRKFVIEVGKLQPRPLYPADSCRCAIQPEAQGHAGFARTCGLFPGFCRSLHDPLDGAIIVCYKL